MHELAIGPLSPNFMLFLWILGWTSESEVVHASPCAINQLMEVSAYAYLIQMWDGIWNLEFLETFSSFQHSNCLSAVSFVSYLIPGGLPARNSTFLHESPVRLKKDIVNQQKKYPFK